MHVHEHRVAAAAWLAHCTDLAAAGATMLDMLTAVDDPGGGRIEVVAHLVDVPNRERHLVWTERRPRRPGPRLAGRGVPGGGLA